MPLLLFSRGSTVGPCSRGAPVHLRSKVTVERTFAQLCTRSSSNKQQLLRMCFRVCLERMLRAKSTASPLAASSCSTKYRACLQSGRPLRRTHAHTRARTCAHTHACIHTHIRTHTYTRLIYRCLEEKWPEVICGRESGRRDMG